jgi:predicted amidohydrolase
MATMSLRVSAIQLAFAYASSPQEFYDRVFPLIERAAQDGAQIVALPDYAGLMLLGIAVPVEPAALPLGEIARVCEYPTVAAMLLHVAPMMHQFYLHLFGSLAARLNIFLAPGTVIERSDDQLFNAAYLFAPDGTVVGSQRQTHRAAREMAWGLSRGSELRVFDLEIARIGFVVGTDIEYPEVARILALQNANLLIHPAAYPVWHPQYFLLDLWREVQANQVFGVQACAIGAEVRGKSAVYAPVEMTDAHCGWLAQAERADAEEIVSADLDFDALQNVIDGYPIFSYLNYDFYADQFPGVYRSWTE